MNDRVSINHVSILATDLEASIEFYVELLGPEHCERIPTPDFGVPAPVQWLRVGDRAIHLFELPIPVASTYYHFGVGARDIEHFHHCFRFARELGVLESNTYGHYIYEMPGGDVQLYITDPAGNLVEIDWRDAGEVDRELVTDFRSIADRKPQGEDSLTSSLYLDRLVARGVVLSDPAAAEVTR